MNPSDAITAAHALLRLLPQRLLSHTFDGNGLPVEFEEALAERGVLTVADLITVAGDPAMTWPEALAAAVRTSLATLLMPELAHQCPVLPFDATDWPSLQANLLLPLDEPQRALLRALLGIDQEPTTATEHARRVHADPRAVEALLERTRQRLHECSPQLMAELRSALQNEHRAGDGVLDPEHMATGTLLHTMARANDPHFPLRLAAFCFPHECHLQGGLLLAGSRRNYRRLCELLRTTLARHRLPVPLDMVLTEIEARRKGLLRGFVVHVLRRELRVAITIEESGEMLVPDARTTTARLAALLEEEGRPMPLQDLVFAYRERYRRVTPSRIEQCVRREPTFVLTARDTIGLRCWFAVELQAAAELADRTARHVVAEGGKQNVLRWLADRGIDERTAYLVQDRLAGDSRVRLLGRGEACPATQRRSQVLAQLLTDMRRAGGDVVESRFVGNQPFERQRLVRRLLAENRLFVRPGPDRVDTLTNYPFNDDRLRRTEQCLRAHLEGHAGHADIAALKDELDATDLGGSWLVPELLADIVRRHGWFDVLPGGIVALRERTLAATLQRHARRELRAAGVQLTVEEIVQKRPDLREFSACLAELLQRDPLVQSPDGQRFCLL